MPVGRYRPLCHKRRSLHFVSTTRSHTSTQFSNLSLNQSVHLAMTHAGSTSVDATNGRSFVSESSIAYSEFHRHENGLDDVPTLKISRQDESGDAACSPNTPHHQHDERESKLIASEIFRRDTEREKIGQDSWLVPHTAELQKRMWYRSSLGMETKHVVDAWGFSSTSGSRSQSPANATQDAENATDAKK